MKQPALGRKIVELRKAKGLTQEELVEKCNLNVRTLQRIEAGEVTPRSHTVKLIFTALDYDFPSEIVPGKFGKAGFILIQRLEQLYRYLNDLLDLKTNTMRKISISSLFLLLAVFLAFNLKVHSQSGEVNPLIGKWKLVGIAKELSALDDQGMVKIHDSSTRFLEFRPDSHFETRTIHNGIYNAGAYNVINDSSFVTAHFGFNRKLADVSHLYTFKIQGDTLHFKGFYMREVPKGALMCDENFYKPVAINEWWVKLEDDEK